MYYVYFSSGSIVELFLEDVPLLACVALTNKVIMKVSL